jgi:hypothetical protein
MKKTIISSVISLLFFFLVTNVISQNVYITKTGKKYHNEGCTYLSKSKIPINLADAITKGYQPCKVCKPPTKVESNNAGTTVKSATTNTKDNIIIKNGRRSVKVQCSATTKKGTRCKRMTDSPNGLCYQHGGD